MSNLNNKQKILNALKNKSLVKVISGIQNYDKQKTLKVAMAAELGEATALDICDDSEIIKTVRASVQLPIFVSSINPEKLVTAQAYGVDVLEIGNYESFYKESRLFTPKEILEITRKVKGLISKEVLLCCTIPSTLETETQIKLAKELLGLGVDILQTEGFTLETPVSDRDDVVYNDILKAASTLTNTFRLRESLPDANIITASGITTITSSLAFAMGSSGIGVGYFINSLYDQIEMTERVKEVMENVSRFSSQVMEKEKTLVFQTK